MSEGERTLTVLRTSAIRRFSAAAFGGVALILFAVGTVGYRTAQRSADANQSVAHSYQVLDALERVLRVVTDAETGARGFTMTGMPGYLEPFNRAATQLSSRVDAVAGLTADIPGRQPSVTDLRTHTGAALGLLRDMVSRTESHESIPVELSDRERASMDAVRVTVRLMRMEEQELMAQRTRDAASADARTRALIIALIALAFTVLGASFVLLDRRTVQLGRLNESLTGRVRERTGRLEQSLANEHEARLEAERAQQRLHQVIEAAPTAIVTVDRRGVVVFANSLTERLFGYMRGELVGQPVEILVPERFRQGHVRYRTGFSNAPTMRPMGAGRDLYGVRRDKSEFPIEVGLNPVDVEGDALVLCSVVDITERKRLEDEREQSLARFESLLAHAPMGIALFDTDLRYVLMNEHGAAASGLSPDAFVGHQVGEFAGWGPRVEGLLRRVLETREPVFGLEVSAETPAAPGERCWMESYYPVVNHKGDVLAIGGLSLEITERKHAEDERTRLFERERQARAEADAANHAKDVFLALVSHELRTPLSALVGWTRMLRDGRLPPDKVRQAVESIDRNGEVLRTLVEDLVDMSRITTGTLRLDRRNLDIAVLVREAMQLLEPTASAKDICVDPNIESRSMVVNGDPTRLRQVVWNLLSNAVKFTPAHGHVRLTARLVGDEVEIRVVDSGQGIAPEFLPHVFEPFSQAERGGHGLGLGLAIVHELVSAHGGRIEAMSGGIGAGTTFSVALPAVRVAEGV